MIKAEIKNGKTTVELEGNSLEIALELAKATASFMNSATECLRDGVTIERFMACVTFIAIDSLVIPFDKDKFAAAVAEICKKAEN